jgi:hypothetical protein
MRGNIGRVILAALVLSLACATAVAASAPASAAVTVVVHVPLQLNSGKRTSPDVIARYEAAFRRIGTVVERPGLGSWIPNGSTRLAFDADDHVFIITTLARARTFLASFLPQMRGDLSQEATLGEIFGGWYGSVGERKRRIDVILPLTCWCEARIRAIHTIFAGAGGASEYDDRDGIHVYSSVNPARAASVVAALRRLHVTPQVTKSTFILAE